MCLLVLAWRVHPQYRLVVAANRDEFHERPTAPMAQWPAPNDILAGRDLRAQGTWLGLNRRRHFGVVTNFRDLQRAHPGAPSRGRLIPDFLGGSDEAGAFLTRLQSAADAYSGFNLLLADGESLWYASNRSSPPGTGTAATQPERDSPSDEGLARTDGFARALPPGIYGLSNQFLDTPWPKLRRVRRQFESWLASGVAATADQLFDILNDRTTVSADEELPQTGLSTEWERVLSSPFVLNPDFGTRCSSVLLLRPCGAFDLSERTFDARGDLSGQTRWQLNAGEWP